MATTGSDPRSERGCTVCGRRPTVGVRAVPHAPVSDVYCRECDHRDAVPAWVVRAHQRRGTAAGRSVWSRLDLIERHTWTADAGYLSVARYLATVERGSRMLRAERG